MAALLRARAFAPFTLARPQFASCSRVGHSICAPSRLSSPRTQRGALQVVAAEGEEKKAKKAMSSPVKRALLAEDRRLYNRSHKSACATRIKKVIKLATTMTSAPPKSEDDVKPLERLISEAYQEIDKAVVKGVLHKNNGARKKARVARYKRQVLIAGGLFTPAEDHPDHAKFARLAAKGKVAADAAAAKPAKAAVKQ